MDDIVKFLVDLIPIPKISWDSHFELIDYIHYRLFQYDIVEPIYNFCLLSYTFRNNFQLCSNLIIIFKYLFQIIISSAKHGFVTSDVIIKKIWTHK
jgi:hypothetical protein